MPTLIIHEVDFKLLEEQRKILVGLHMSSVKLSTKQDEALAGVLALLDDWSDKRFMDGVST